MGGGGAKFYMQVLLNLHTAGCVRHRESRDEAFRSERCVGIICGPVDTLLV